MDFQCLISNYPLWCIKSFYHRTHSHCYYILLVSSSSSINPQFSCFCIVALLRICFPASRKQLQCGTSIRFVVMCVMWDKRRAMICKLVFLDWQRHSLRIDGLCNRLGCFAKRTEENLDRIKVGLWFQRCGTIWFDYIMITYFQFPAFFKGAFFNLQRDRGSQFYSRVTNHQILPSDKKYFNLLCEIS